MPYVEQSITTARVISPQIRATYDEPTGTLDTVSIISGVPLSVETAYSVTCFVTSPLTRSPIAFPARESPIIATVGPITTAGMSLLSQPTPTNFTTIAITTFTSPARNAPTISPSMPCCIETPPAKAAAIEPKKAKDEPRNTGLFLFVKRI